MATNWKVPTTDDAKTYMAAAVVDAANVVDSAGNLRFVAILQTEVDRIRAAVDNGGRVPLSLTVNSIPPEAVQYCMVLALNMLLAAAPRIVEYATSAQWDKMVVEANDWIKDTASGENVPTTPSDPDPLTEPSGFAWGDINGVSKAAQVAIAGAAGVSVAVPQTTPGKVDLTTD